MNSTELHRRTSLLLTSPLALHQHNLLISTIYANLTRDLPEPGVAPWVSANDKPTLAPKPVSGDAAEQRLKTEIMGLPARDRRRLKEVREEEYKDRGGHERMAAIERNKESKGIKMPDTVPASAGGFNKTNWDMEIRKRYLAPLATETFEFPDPESILARMIPTCYEYSLPNGCTATCAELLSSATEQYVKEVMSAVMLKTRSNIGGSRSGDGIGIITSKFRKLLAREEEAAERGQIKRSEGVGLLPCEVKERKARRGIGIGDLRFAEEIGGVGMGQMLTVVKSVMGDYEEGVLERWTDDFEEIDSSAPLLDSVTQDPADPTESDPEIFLKSGLRHPPPLPKGRLNPTSIVASTPTNGIFLHQTDDAEIDDLSSMGWDGVGSTDRSGLDSLLDECLALG